MGIRSTKPLVSGMPSNDVPRGRVPAVGETVAGKYRIERVLGVGGMGMVVAAHHVTLEQEVAVKFLLPENVNVAGATARFLREAQAALQIHSEHVARVLDVGTLEDGLPYMVMELLVGVDLGELVASNGPLPIGAAVDYVLQACEAMAEAHALGIVHRDLKPSNLFLIERADGSPLVKVLDFGIAKSGAEGPNPALTATGIAMGSPQYMSPEQLRDSKSVDSRSDVWSLGIILYELMTGRVPFDGASAPAVCAAIAADPPVPLRTLKPEAPAGLEAVILGCLQKRPALRVPDVAALARALEPFADQASRISIERVVNTVDRVRDRVTPTARVGRGSISASLMETVPSRPSNVDSDPSGDALALRTETSPSAKSLVFPSPSPPHKAEVESTHSAWNTQVERRTPRRVWLIAAASFGLMALTALGIRLLRTPAEPPGATVDPSRSSASFHPAEIVGGTVVPEVTAASPLGLPAASENTFDAGAPEFPVITAGGTPPLPPAKPDGHSGTGPAAPRIPPTGTAHSKIHDPVKGPPALDPLGDRK